MSRLSQTPLSVLDLAPIVVGGSARQAFINSLDLAQHAERWDYRRFWLAEHHNIPGVASAATSVVIGYVAGGTSRIRVGAGGIMLPNHSPLTIAEQFGTLESLYPGRIDLGLGRAPGGDQATARALRRYAHGGVDTFPQDVVELIQYFQPASPGQRVTAIPGAGLRVPVWILGSSEFGAQLAAELGLPYAFASHFAPDYMYQALRLYRELFRPSAELDRPHAMVGVNVIAADTDAEAGRLSTSLHQQFVNLIRGAPGEVMPPVHSMEGRWTPAEQAHVERMTRVSAIGSPQRVREQLEDIVHLTKADELILTAQIYDHAARLRSFEIAAEVATNA